MDIDQKLREASDNFQTGIFITLREIDLMFDEARATGDVGKRQVANAMLKRLTKHVDGVAAEVDRI